PESRSRIPEGLPARELLRNERRAFLIIATVQDGDVVSIGRANKHRLSARLHLGRHPPES
ncbi:MAG: hypothetical protein WA694_03790, partial [Pseudolabrys sp.]